MANDYTFRAYYIVKRSHLSLTFELFVIMCVCVQFKIANLMTSIDDLDVSPTFLFFLLMDIANNQFFNHQMQLQTLTDIHCGCGNHRISQTSNGILNSYDYTEDFFF